MPINGAQTVTAFITGYGAGGDSTTVGVKDCQGRVVAGRDGTLGTLTNRLTSSYFGANSAVINTPGGAENVTMASGNLIAHTHANTLTDPGHTHSGFVPSQGSTQTGAGGQPGLGGNNTGVVNGTITINSNTTGITINNASAGSGSPTPMRTVQPTVTAECVVVVLP